MDLRAKKSYGVVAAVIVVAAIVRCFIWLNSDVSWLLTLAEQVLGGARAYRDFSEPNPPASILIYMPAILISHLANLSAEAAVTILVFTGAFWSLWLMLLILPGDELVRTRERPLVVALACALLLILPGDNFAERENVALIAILPMLAVYVRRASGGSPNMALATLAGIGGGIAVAIKPYFALALLLPLPLVLWRCKSSTRTLVTAIISPEHIGATLVVLSYAAVLVWAFPEYTQNTLPLVLTLYVPLRYSLPLMLANPSVIMIALAALVGVGMGAWEFRGPFVGVMSLAALGFTGALIVQGKGWPYHGYPAVALSLFVLGVLLLRRISSSIDGGAAKSLSLDVKFGAGLLACIYALASYWLLQEPSRDYLVSVVSRMVPAHPKVFSIYGAPGLAFPLTRKLHGAPLGRTPFQWISAYTDVLLTAGELDPAGKKQIVDPALRRTIEDYARRDRDEVADTIRTRRPDVILVGGNGEEQWALSKPQIAAALRPYHKVKTVGDVEIWLPRQTTADH